MDAIRYPIGPFTPQEEPTKEERQQFIGQIPAIVPTLRQIIMNLTPSELDASYREGGWSIRQIIHHLADNDMNAYLRFKRALTEDEPMASSYREDLWAELSDYSEVPIENSLTLLETLHFRFLILLKELKPEDFQRTMRTQVLGSITLDIALQRFVWHNRHHIAQITSISKREMRSLLEERRP
ncbi:putative metal-dependent hydrolase [Paenibacillus glucanolyticus]|uniref:YfiT family bacillithiol transferase n=1 Tax=Paenibacillus TaxID=44249 RepID=UPI0003E236A4|nr:MULTISPECIES: putative metal-dependent hydrolase [Paenibacillus]ANA78565.1 metal-dependent hydrolase [Paenibacillus glucanolyticus]AVV57520.1 putative metal-dependent hydrolase [Paenibacillus glucanolyticus]ETT34957.1 metal-dependent hydrolase [Paenibacillus sp. FSL R5-808]